MSEHLSELLRVLGEKGLDMISVSDHIGFPDGEYNIENLYEDFLLYKNEKTLEEFIDHTMRPRPVIEKEIRFETTNFFEDGEEDNDSIPFMTQYSVDELLKKVKNIDEIVITENTIQICFSYPFDGEYYFHFVADKPEGFTKGHLVRCIVEKYINMYNEEEKTLTTNIIPENERQGLLNRNQTDGMYGIWGHDLRDLSLNSMYKIKGEDCWHLSIDS